MKAGGVTLWYYNRPEPGDQGHCNRPAKSLFSDWL
jgi:hypothetical protein